MDDRRREKRSRTPSSEVPPKPHPAATVVLVRPAGPIREVLLLRRPVSSSFAPDAWVFPGGRVDEADFCFDHSRLAAGPSPEEWSRELSIRDPGVAAAYPVAAAREVWEETGYLLTEQDCVAPDAATARSALLRGEVTLQAYLHRNGLRLATGRLRYLAHWITPEWLPLRFDTRFFLCSVGRDFRCELTGAELVEHRWLTATSALQAASDREMSLLPPTLDTLRRLERGEL